MRIYNYEVGPGHPTFVVAEFGSNHGGSLEAALALINAAADAGANAVKGQLWLSADEMYDKEQFPDEWESTQKYALPKEWLQSLQKKAHDRGMAFGLSSFGFASLDEADKWVDFHKIASIEAGWGAFVSAVRKKGKPLIVSTGMMDAENRKAASQRATGAIPARADTVRMQCTVSYPAEISDVHLLAHPDRGRWGLSDHTLHPTIAPCAAVALGACVIEKHVRFDETNYNDPTGPYVTLQTPDTTHSINQYEFKEMVSAIRLTEQALGSSEKRIRPSEEKYLRYRRGPRGLRGS